MLVEVKVKVSRIINEKTRKRNETYLVDNCQLFTEAEYYVTSELTEEQQSNLIVDFDIQSLKVSSIKEVYTQIHGETPFIVTLKDIFIADDGTEKPLKYKVILWADSLSDANRVAHELAREGYDMYIEGIKEVDYEYINIVSDEQTPVTNEE